MIPQTDETRVEPKETTRTFPIQRNYNWPGDQLRAIPWRAIAPHERQAQWNHDQSLKRLAERGGLSACEAVAVLEDRPWHRMGPADADYRLRQLAGNQDTANA